jgi:hypothetical protein
MDTDLPSIHRSFVNFLAYIFVDCKAAHAQRLFIVVQCTNTVFLLISHLLLLNPTCKSPWLRIYNHPRLRNVVGRLHQAPVVQVTPLRPSLRCISLHQRLALLVGCHVSKHCLITNCKFYSRRASRLLLHPISCRPEGCPSNIKCPDTIIS